MRDAKPNPQGERVAHGRYAEEVMTNSGMADGDEDAMLDGAGTAAEARSGQRAAAESPAPQPTRHTRDPRTGRVRE